MGNSTSKTADISLTFGIGLPYYYHVYVTRGSLTPQITKTEALLSYDVTQDGMMRCVTTGFTTDEPQHDPDFALVAPFVNRQAIAEMLKRYESAYPHHIESKADEVHISCAADVI